MNESLLDRVRREDTAGWKLDHYRILIRFDDARASNMEILDREAAQAKLRDLTGPAHRRFFAIPWKRRSQ